MNSIWISIFLLLLSSSLTVIVQAKDYEGWTFRERQTPHESYMIKGRANIHAMHTLSIEVELLNIPLLEELVQNISNPFHLDYGKYWTKTQIGHLITNHEAITNIINYFHEQGNIEILSMTPLGEYIEVKATIKTWERIFKTKFYQYEHKLKKNNLPIYRAKEYFIPNQLHSSIKTIFHLIHFPIDLRKSLVLNPIPMNSSSSSSSSSAKKNHLRTMNNNNEEEVIETKSTDYVTPNLINSIYQIPFNNGQGYSTQSAFECVGQYLAPNDLTTFFEYFNLPSQSLSSSIGGHVENDACQTYGLNSCYEANLDYQWMMAIAQNIPTISLYDDSGCDFRSFLASLMDPPKVISISYGGVETTIPKVYSDAFNNVALTLSAMGVTIVVSAGDDGAASYEARNNPSGCAYRAIFPATSNYVLAVGGTQGPEIGDDEVACQSNIGGTITTGGGFSIYNSLPTWQTNQVNQYFQNMVNHMPLTGYATNARGYPDISALAHNYPIVLAGTTFFASGTSASAPVVAAMISLINSVRTKNGKPLLGFINPFLYTFSSYFINDITIGENYCTASSTCCLHGFQATTGWDPVTGLGTLNLNNFYNFAINLENFLISSAPIYQPTSTPSEAPVIPSSIPTEEPSYSQSPVSNPTSVPSITTLSPTPQPTLLPTRSPSRRPSFRPTKKPSMKPTRKPTMKPSMKPTCKPTMKPTVKSTVKTGFSTNKPTIKPTINPTVKH